MSSNFQSTPEDYQLMRVIHFHQRLEIQVRTKKNTSAFPQVFSPSLSLLTVYISGEETPKKKIKKSTMS